MTPNGCGLFGCDKDKDHYYQDDYNNYNDFNTRRQQQQNPPSKKKNFFDNFFQSSNKPKRHYQPETFFQPSNQYPQYPQQNPIPQTFNENRYQQSNYQYQDKNNYYQKQQNPSPVYDNLQGSQQSIFDAHRFSNKRNNGQIGTQKKVKFGSNNENRQPVQQVVRHEHYHFHENSDTKQHNNRAQYRQTVPQLTPLNDGISFGYNDYPAFLNERPQFRSSLVPVDNDEEITPESDKNGLESQNIKFAASAESANKKQKNAFSFPKSQTNKEILNRSKRDDHAPYSLAPQPEKQIEGVRNSIQIIFKFLVV